MYDWSKESTIRLIEHYQVHPILWDSRHNDFKDESKKREAWTEISVLMKSERAEVERKMRLLIFQYNREKKKSIDKKYGDNITESLQFPRKWYAMNSMSFLSDISKTALPSMKIEQELRTIEPSEMKCQNSRRRISSSQQRVVRNSSIVKRRGLTNGKKLMKRKHEDVVNEGLQAGTKSLQQKKQSTRDEFQIYGEHIACKIRKLPTQYSKVTVEHHINNIIHQAELGQYNNPPTVTNTFGTSSSMIKPRSFKPTSNISSAVTSSQGKSTFGSTKESRIISAEILMTRDDTKPAVMKSLISSPIGIV